MADKLTGLILAGGLGTRMRPFTLHTPKCLIPVAGKPFLDWQLLLLAKNNVSSAIMSTGYLGHKIEEYLENNDTHGVDVQVHHEKEQLGTGGAIMHSLPLLPEKFFLIYGDGYLLEPFSPISAAFEKSGKDALMTVMRQSSGTSENNCEMKNGMVVRYQKKQPAGTFQFLDYGLLFFMKSALAGYPLANFPTDRIFSDLIAKNNLAAFEATRPYYEVGSREGLRNFTDYIKSVEKG